MPKQKRWEIKQKLGYAVKHFEIASGFLAEIGAMFEGRSDGYSEKFMVLYQAALKMKEATQQISDQI